MHASPYRAQDLIKLPQTSDGLNLGNDARYQLMMHTQAVLITSLQFLLHMHASPYCAQNLIKLPQSSEGLNLGNDADVLSPTVVQEVA